MRIRQFENELHQLCYQTRDLLVDEEMLSETVTVRVNRSTRTIKIYLGDKVSYRELTVGDPFIFHPPTFYNELYNLSGIYTAKDKIWMEVLGSFKTKVGMATALNEKLVDALVYPYISEAVLDRLTGSDYVADNRQTIIRAAQKRITRLEGILPDGPKRHRQEFVLLSPSENYTLTVNFRWGNSDIRYGELGESLKQSWSLLSHYPQLEAIVTEFAVAIKPVFDLLSDD